MEGRGTGFTLLMVGYDDALEICRLALLKAGKPTEQKHVEASYVVLTHAEHQPECVYELGHGWVCDLSCSWHKAALPEQEEEEEQQ